MELWWTAVFGQEENAGNWPRRVVAERGQKKTNPKDCLRTQTVLLGNGAPMKTAMYLLKWRLSALLGNTTNEVRSSKMEAGRVAGQQTPWARPPPPWVNEVDWRKVGSPKLTNSVVGRGKSAESQQCSSACCKRKVPVSAVQEARMFRWETWNPIRVGSSSSEEISSPLKRRPRCR